MGGHYNLLHNIAVGSSIVNSRNVGNARIPWQIPRVPLDGKAPK
jgi:hypothetical protein